MALRPKEKGHIKIFGKDTEIPRYHLLVGKSTYSFSGITLPTTPLDPKEHAVLIRLLKFVNDREPKYTYTGMLVNWYLDGNDYIGPHSDDEKDLVLGAPIYSFSFGSTRTFRFLPKKRGAKVLDIELESGMLVTMCGDCQKEFKHSVPVRKRCTEPRINITVRAFRT